MSDHSSKVHPKIAAYFGIEERPHSDQHPTVWQVFSPQHGWRNETWRKRVSLTYLRTLRREGVVAVAIRAADGRLADFAISEVT